MKIGLLAPLLALLFICFVQADEVQGSLNAPIYFSTTTDNINIVDANGNSIIYISFVVSRGPCSTGKCNLTMATIQTLNIPSGSNLPTTSSIIDPGFGQAMNITVYPSSVLLSDFTIQLVGYTPTQTSFSAFIFDTVWGQFGITPFTSTSVGVTIQTQADYLVPAIYLLATTTSTDPVSLVTSQYYAVTDGQTVTIALSSSVQLTLTTVYKNAIRIFQSTKNSGATIGPDGYNAPKNWYQVQLQDPYYQTTGRISGSWKYTSGNPNSTILSYNAYNTKTWNTFVYNQTRIVKSTTTNVVFNQLAGTWGFYSPGAASQMTMSIVMIGFMMVVAMLV